MICRNDKVVLFFTVILYLLCASNGARILGVFPMAAPSHYILGSNYMRALAEAGHDVTVISPFGEKVPPKNGTYRDIILKGFLEKHEEMRKERNMFSMKPSNSLGGVLLMRYTMNKMFSEITELVLKNDDVQKLLKSNEKFDLVIFEQFGVDALKGIAYHFGAPHVLFVTVGASLFIDSIVCNPSPPSYVPEMPSLLPIKMTFFQRMLNVFLKLINEVVTKVIDYRTHSKILRKYFPNAPELEEVNQNYSLVMLNSHPSLHQAVPHVPAMIEIGGFHVKPPKKLPQDLQTFLDNAKEGVIYFSMGSNLKSKDLPEDKRNAFLQTFAKLKEKVLWKWEDDVLPGQPPNVKLGKWLPQSDILAHPNVKAFITHGGLLSTIEAVYHGVPVIAIPIFGDQMSNAHQAVENGFGLSLKFHELSENLLTSTVREMLDNPKYRENAKKRSQVFHDRPQTPIEAAVYWTEYALRHPGGSHLKVAGAELPWYKYMLLDVFLFIGVVSLTSICVIKTLIKKICRRWTKKNSKPKED